MKVAIIGLGYWGPNLVRNFSALDKVNELYACDLNGERLKKINKQFPNVKLENDFANILSKDIDAVVIATPVRTHYELGLKALESGKHIWLEKPFTASSEQASHLLEIADKKNLKIFVDHTFIYTGAVRKIREILDANEIGQIKYFDSVRINLGLFQHDINVIWDLAPHDLSIMDYVLNHQKIVAVSANGVANYYDYENIAQLSIYFENNCFGNIHVNWTSPVKIRRMIIGGSKKMLLYNDMENFEKIKVYDSSIEMKTQESIHEALVQYRIGDMYSPKVRQTEALSIAAEEFINAINNNRQPLTNGRDGLRIVQLLEACEKSIKNRGMLVEVDLNI